MHSIKIDLYSDTMTQPSEGMKQAMMAAPLGDEQKGEDPTTLKLEHVVAEMTGFSSALFVPSATLANQMAIQLHCPRGHEVLAADSAHIIMAEAGGPAANAGVMIRAIPTDNGIFAAEHLAQSIFPPLTYHLPRAGMIEIENTTNIGGGIPWSHEQLQSVIAVAKEADVPVHMDGARFFHASIATGMAPQEITNGLASLTICFSKGLGCATGAVLAFDEKHRDQLIRIKQRMGGSMRQSGILSGACLYALEHHLPELEKDHQKARRLAEIIGSLPQEKVQMENPEPPTNIAYFYWKDSKMSPLEFNSACLEKGLRFSQMGPNRFRAVCHRDVSLEDVEATREILMAITSS